MPTQTATKVEQKPSEPPAVSTGNNVFLVFSLLLLVFIWFFSNKKQKNREREEARMRKDIEIGDEIITVGGIVGIIVTIKDDVFTLETGSDRSKLRLEKGAIRTNVTAQERQAKQAEEKEKQKGTKER
jgi:preprotein translocase subunit YajC